MADPSYPDDRLYHSEHDWAQIDGEAATLGITWYAQDALGEVVFFDAPAVGKSVTKDESYAEIESVKAVSELYAPASGKVVAINEELATAPEKINTDAHNAWIVKIQLKDSGEVNKLLSSEDYDKLVKEEGGN